MTNDLFKKRPQYRPGRQIASLLLAAMRGECPAQILADALLDADRKDLADLAAREGFMGIVFVLCYMHGYGSKVRRTLDLASNAIGQRRNGETVYVCGGEPTLASSADAIPYAPSDPETAGGVTTAREGGDYYYNVPTIEAFRKYEHCCILVAACLRGEDVPPPTFRRWFPHSRYATS